jgi:hypothetical protein
MRAAPITSQGSEFQQFLYAPICEDHEGMTLSVLSALARQDIDPWTEAARLSQLPEETAVEQIIALLDALPRRIVASLDRMKVASRLSALLPRATASNLSGVRPAAAAGRTKSGGACFQLALFLSLSLHDAFDELDYGGIPRVAIRCGRI